MTRRATSVVRRIRLWLKELPLVFGFIAGVVFTRSLTLLSMTENDFGETYPFSGVDSSLKPFRLDHHSSNLNEVVVGRNIPKAPPLEKKKQTPLPTKTEDATKEDLRPNVTTKEATNAVIVEHVARKSLMMEDQTKKNATIINFQEGLSATVKNTAHARRKYVRYNIPWEFYKEQIESGNLTAGQEFLDFAVVGFPKCGTSTMSKLHTTVGFDQKTHNFFSRRLKTTSNNPERVT